MDLNRLSSQIIKAAITVHKELGPGLLESVYHACMLIELRNMGIRLQSEVMLPHGMRNLFHWGGAYLNEVKKSGQAKKSSLWSLWALATLSKVEGERA